MTEKTAEFNKDHYRTPRYVFHWLERRFYWFHIDGCASYHNALCYRYIGEPAPDGYGDDDIPFPDNISVAPDFLADDLFEKLLDEVVEQTEMLRIFVNPPYSNPLPFVERAAELKKAGYLVVMLLPADKSTKWYKVIQENATEVIDIIGGRINFLHPVTGEEVKGNNKGSMVAVFDPFMQGFVTRQVELDFVKKCGGYYGA